MSKGKDYLLVDTSNSDETAGESTPKVRKINSMASLLINNSETEHRGTSKKMKNILIETNDSDNKNCSDTQSTVKKVGVPQSKKIQEPQLPSWEQNLAMTFLMTCNVSDSVEHKETINSEVEHISEEMTRCLCNSNHESDVMILCDSCKKWMHVNCVRLQNSQDVDPFVCIYCQYEMSKAIKSFVRAKLMNITQKIKEKRIQETTPVWNELLQTILDIQSVLRIVPQFLPMASTENT